MSEKKEKKKKEKKKWRDTWKKEKIEKEIWKYTGTDRFLVELANNLSKIESKYKSISDENFTREVITTLETLRKEPMRTNNPMIEQEKERAIREEVPLTNVEDYLLGNFVESSNPHNLENKEYVKQIENRKKQDDNRNKRIKFASSSSNVESRFIIWKDYQAQIKSLYDPKEEIINTLRDLLVEGNSYFVNFFTFFS